jgi:molecular chaperone HscB
VLSLKGLLETDEKYQLDPSFLMEVMELNEKMMEGDESPASLEEQLNALYGSIYENVAATIENYQEGVTSEKELLQAKEYYYQKKYLDRIKNELQN